MAPPWTGSPLIGGALLASAQLLWAPLGTTPLAAQEGAWNAPEVMMLVRRGIERRLEPLHDSTLTYYSARADGVVHFFVEREDGGEPIPMRTDQVSLDLYWRAPDFARQVIRGYRQEDLLPIRDFRYYLDRLTVIHNGFGDEIQVGEGLDVRNVVHPLSPRGPAVYEYRSRGALTLSFVGVPEPIVVEEIEVRPRDPSRPGFVGSVFVDRAAVTLVRLDFTFTPSSYVDPRDDQVRIALEFGLWQGRHWLPYRQRLRVRREVPWLDLPVASVIEGELKVVEYHFDDPPPEDLFASGRTVVFPADGVGDTTRFERSLRDEREAWELTARGYESVRTEALRAMREQALSGLPSSRLSMGRGVSSLVRANRAEGLFLGAGATLRPGGPWTVDLGGGYAIGAEEGSARVALVRTEAVGSASLNVEAEWQGIADLAPETGIAGAVNSVSATFFGRDFSDPFHRDRVRIALGPLSPAPASELEIELAVERHRPIGLSWDEAPVGGSAFRPPLPVEEGTYVGVGLDLRRERLDWRGWRSSLGVRVEGGLWEDEVVGRLTLSGASWREIGDGAWGLSTKAQAGVTSRGSPAQRHFHLGGWGTVPGQPHRAFSGPRFAALRIDLDRTLVPGWLDARAFAAVGATGGRPRIPAGSEASPLTGSDGARPGAGIGLGIFQGFVRIEWAQGLGPGGRGAWMLQIDPRLRGLF